MTNNVTPIKRQRVKIDTGLRFYFAEFTGKEHDDIALYDSLSITLNRAAGLLDFVEEAMEENSSKQAIASAESSKVENIVEGEVPFLWQVLTHRLYLLLPNTPRSELVFDLTR